jgi:hypothetical protein
LILAPRIDEISQGDGSRVRVGERGKKVGIDDGNNEMGTLILS